MVVGGLEEALPPTWRHYQSSLIEELDSLVFVDDIVYENIFSVY